MMSHASPAKLHIGISGWRYEPWRGDFYPEGLNQNRELEYASRQVNSIEINGTFYALQKPQSFKNWYTQTPGGFTFSVKAPRYITHIRRLDDVKKPIANFFASGVLCLQEKLGPVLWQLPPSYKYDPDVMEQFLSLLPHNTADARKLAKKHNSMLSDADYGEHEAPVRHSLEVRNKTFKCEEFVQQLRKHHVALVVADTAGRWPLMEDVTTDFMYLRLHGDEELYVSGYTNEALHAWQKKIESWTTGRSPQGTKLVTPDNKLRHDNMDIFIYFDNDVKVHAPYDAMKLAHELKIADKPQDHPPPKIPKGKGRTFLIEQRWH